MAIRVGHMGRRSMVELAWVMGPAYREEHAKQI